MFSSAAINECQNQGGVGERCALTTAAHSLDNAMINIHEQYLKSRTLSYKVLNRLTRLAILAQCFSRQNAIKRVLRLFRIEISRTAENKLQSLRPTMIALDIRNLETNQQFSFPVSRFHQAQPTASRFTIYTVHSMAQVRVVLYGRLDGAIFEGAPILKSRMRKKGL